jgi:glutamate N-acetyltransferase/amino-acid N-acetyltransferase
MNFHEQPRFPRGFRCASRNCGLKPADKDLALFVSDREAAAAAIFTRNQFPGAPVILGRETIKAGQIKTIVVNSKVSNVATGAAGLSNARRMAAAAAAECGTTPDRVLVSSTGVIGVPLPIEKIETGLRGMTAELTDDPLVGARGIMTTDSHPKALSTTVGPATITWIAKGSGMIEPNMATMLVYIFTDAEFEAPVLDQMLRRAAHGSFNMLSVDTDTSTSDTCALLANGMAGQVPEDDFQNALTTGCIRMTEILARDGEGAEHLLRCTVRGGAREDFDDATVRDALKTEVIDLDVSLGVGSASATAYGCDLTKGYVEENAAYYSS